MSDAVNRDTFLQELARESAEALRYWPQLPHGKKLYVESRMRQHYGDDFANAFRQADQGI